MKLEIPTLKQCINNVLHTLQTAFKPNDDAGALQTPVAAKLRRDNDYIESFAIGAAIHGIYKYIADYIAKQSNPLTATGIFLKWWGQVYGVFLKQKSAAQGGVTITALHGTVIPANTVILRSSDGWEYKTDAEILIEGVEGEQVEMAVDVTASLGGYAGNSPIGVVMSMPTPIAGVTGIVVSTAIERGTDDEKEEDFRSRILFRIQNPPHGGAPSDYEMWAREVPGVVDAWCERTPAVPGSVGLRFMMSTGFPVEADQEAVEEYIGDRTRGPGADDLIVTLLEPNSVDITVTGFTPNTSATRAAAKLELQDMFLRFRRPGAVMPISHIRESLSRTSGEYDHALTVPETPPTASADEILVLGVLTINGVVV